MISVTFPVRTESEANLREHWAKKNRRAQSQRQAARLIVGQYRIGMPFILKNVEVILTRIGQKPLDPDNLANSFKHIQDGIADALGIDDGDAQITWRYAQEKGKPKEYAVRVEINT